MDTDERLQRIESDIHEMKADMSDFGRLSFFLLGAQASCLPVFSFAGW